MRPTAWNCTPRILRYVLTVDVTSVPALRGQSSLQFEFACFAVVADVRSMPTRQGQDYLKLEETLSAVEMKLSPRFGDKKTL